MNTPFLCSVVVSAQSKLVAQVGGESYRCLCQGKHILPSSSVRLWRPVLLSKPGAHEQVVRFLRNIFLGIPNPRTAFVFSPFKAVPGASVAATPGKSLPVPPRPRRCPQPSSPSWESGLSLHLSRSEPNFPTGSSRIYRERCHKS